jgi:lipopolysaccharide export LptBFGC system permease protein LptF
MGRTLFWYIFWDLLKIFALTSGVLAGIMSFGGLLRPLTDYGLDSRQVATMLGYFMPAMQTYSLPIAALFATTMVYGRISADNEVVACRAAGVSHLALALPAMVLGLTVALLSLLLLCFIVPAFMLKAEKVIFSNVAQIIANSIERNHQIKLFDTERDQVAVFAQSASVLPADPAKPREQAVVLHEPMIITYEPQTAAEKKDDAPRVPRDFYLASQVTAYITQGDASDDLTFTAIPEGGMKFPRKFAGGSEGGIQYTSFTGQYESLIKEDTKFMDLFRLKELIQDESKARRIRKLLAGFVVAEQEQGFLRDVMTQLSGDATECRLTSSEDTWIITRGRSAMALKKSELTIGPTAPSEEKPIKVRQMRHGEVRQEIAAQQLKIIARADNASGMLNVTLELQDASVRIGGSESARASFVRSFDLKMPPDIAALPAARNATYYARAKSVLPDQQKQLLRAIYIVTNRARSELHSRVSFAVSCLILVMVGCALCLMFRSGNFLTAFALSVVPALITIALIIAGQQTADNVPWDVTHYHNSLHLGLALIWSGNIAVAAIAAVLLVRLQRQ